MDIATVAPLIKVSGSNAKLNPREPVSSPALSGSIPMIRRREAGKSLRCNLRKHPEPLVEGSQSPPPY